ncbi:Retrovirus-related Pol polyprotein from transposon 17.6 [Araneus ventricosus]|uniref:Retrovirus-related Pol polyprotein from transposon 17.6 n=1 Tax=Araneus ventricosus TaxID=182803 RepID=A0A4Y2K176_ARAVE|nr:Retrovirus-related Pol polyprotein from transposon 17.6 [Araneus ventricosus]
MTNRQNDLLKAEIGKMLKYNIIEPGASEFTSPIILVETPGREPRPCIDYRKLNEITRTQFYPIPNIEQRVETVAKARYITLIDLTKGYWQIPLSKRAQGIAAFSASWGVYRPFRMPFGLKNAPFYFSKMMNEILEGCDEYAIPYLDDIAIFSQTWDEHLKHLQDVLGRLKRAKLTIKPPKCKFAQDEVQYLRHLVGHGKRSPAELKKLKFHLQTFYKCYFQTPGTICFPLEVGKAKIWRREEVCIICTCTPKSVQTNLPAPWRKRENEEETLDSGRDRRWVMEAKWRPAMFEVFSNNVSIDLY